MFQDCNNKLCYAELTTNCNLSCPYCYIKDREDGWNRDKFMQQLHDYDGRIIVFGGEPTLYKDRLRDVVLSDPIINAKIDSITTNLIHIDDEILTILKIIGCVGTSYSPSRFTPEQYQTWLRNINEFHDKLPNTKIGILSTMTNELLAIPPEEMMNIMKSWNLDVIDTILFEHVVGPETDKDYFERADNWLCELYKIWDVPLFLRNIDRANKWYFNCDGISTLHPNGEMVKGCPNSEVYLVPDECYTCEKHNECRPCRLQPYCSYMHNFVKLIRETISKEKEEN